MNLVIHNAETTVSVQQEDKMKQLKTILDIALSAIAIILMLPFKALQFIGETAVLGIYHGSRWISNKLE